MNFLGIGPFELLLILVIATVVLGPERMAQAGRTLGRLYAQYRTRWQKDVDEMTRELRRELEMLQQEVEEIRLSAESEIKAAQTAFEDVVGTSIELDAVGAGADEGQSIADPASESVQEIQSPSQAQEETSIEGKPGAETEASLTAREPALDDAEPVTEGQEGESLLETQKAVSSEEEPAKKDESPLEYHESALAEDESVQEIRSHLQDRESESAKVETEEVKGDQS